MRGQCFVPTCKNSVRRGGLLLSFHRFPKGNNEKWLQVIGIKAGTVTTDKRICSEHFRDEDFLSRSSKRILKGNVFPSLRVPPPQENLSTVMMEDTDSLVSCSTTASPVLWDHLPSHFQRLEPVERTQEFCVPILTIRISSNTPEKTDKEQFIMDYEPSPTISEIRRSLSVTNRLLKFKEENEAKRKFKFEHTSTSSLSSNGASTAGPLSGNGPGERRPIIMRTYSHSPSFARVARQRQKTRHYQNKLANARRPIRTVKQKVRHLRDVLSALRKNKNMSTEALNVLESTFSDIPSAVMKRMLINQSSKAKGNVRSKIPPEIRSFAMTLQYYSSKAYDYVRQSFDLALPAPSTIRSWMCKTDCTPGFTECSLKAIKLRADEFSRKHPGKTLMLGLIFDEMAIKKEVIAENHNQTVWGYVDVGAGTVPVNERELATEALTLMVVGLNDNFKLPIAYFLISTLTGAERANIVKEALHHLSHTNAKVLSVTCDGPQVHFKMMSELGCKVLDPDDLKVHFNNPVDNSNVRVMFDVSRMLKLARNNWANEGILKDGSGHLIKWEFIINLIKIREDEGLCLRNKLGKKHLEFKKAIMKVNLAAQTLSESVADALEFLCKDLQLEEFRDVMPTVTFIRTFNSLFDIMNSRNPFGKGMKTPLRPENESYWRAQLEQHLNYIKNLKTINDRPMYLTQKKTPFLGFLVTGKSFLEIFDETVKLKKEMKYILTYKFSQDHLELFFCSVRSRNGCNNNPNALQFMQTYRKLLMHIDIKNNTGNCLDVTSQTPQITDIHVVRSSEKMVEELEEDISVILPVHLNEYQENVVSYISGTVVKIIKNKLSCVTCCEALESFFDEYDSSLKLIKRKSSEALIYPSRSVREVCMKVEKKIQTTIKLSGGLPPKDTLIKSLYNNMNLLLLNAHFFSDLHEHVFDYTPYEEHHKKILLELIIKTYSNIRINSLCRKISQDISGEKIRKTFSKLILFKHQ